MFCNCRESFEFGKGEFSLSPEKQVRRKTKNEKRKTKNKKQKTKNEKQKTKKEKKKEMNPGFSGHNASVTCQCLSWMGS